MKMVNAKEFAKLKSVSSRTVTRWYEKGYLPHATQDENTKIYSIPDDTPRPYKGNAQVKRITELMPMLLDAADLQQSVFPQMFPQLEHATLNRKIDELVDDGLICIQTTPTGDRYLELTSKGEKENSRLRQKKQEKIISVAKTVGKFMH